MDGQGKENRPQRITLLNSPGAGDGLITSSAGAGEKMTVMVITAVDPRSERRERSVDRLQEGRAMHGVEGVGNVHRDCCLAAVQTMLLEPLAGGVSDDLTTVGGLEAELKRLKDGACPVREEFNCHLAGDPANVLSHGDWAKRPVGLAKGHYGHSTNKRANRLRSLAL